MQGKLSSYIMYVLMAIGVVGFIIVLMQVDEDDPSTYGYCNALIYPAYAFFGVCALLAIVGSGVGLVVNPKGIKGSAIGLVSLIVVAGISYAMASDSVVGYEGLDPMTSRLSGMGLYAFYILFLGAAVSIAGSTVVKLIK